jgi:hypothetical protein
MGIGRYAPTEFVFLASLARLPYINWLTICALIASASSDETPLPKATVVAPNQPSFSLNLHKDGIAT